MNIRDKCKEAVVNALLAGPSSREFLLKRLPTYTGPDIDNSLLGLIAAGNVKSQGLRYHLVRNPFVRGEPEPTPAPAPIPVPWTQAPTIPREDPPPQEQAEMSPKNTIEELHVCRTCKAEKPESGFRRPGQRGVRPKDCISCRDKDVQTSATKPKATPASEPTKVRAKPKRKPAKHKPAAKVDPATATRVLSDDALLLPAQTELYCEVFRDAKKEINSLSLEVGDDKVLLSRMQAEKLSTFLRKAVG